MDNSESRLTPHFIESSIKRLRDDFDRLRRKGTPIHHALIESASADREHLLLENMERVKALPPKWTVCAEQDGLRSLRTTYAPSDLIEKFSQLEHQGNLLLKSIDTTSLRLQFGTLKQPPWGWGSSWVIFVHVLSWHKIPGTLLSAERWSCIKLNQRIPLEHVLLVRTGLHQPIENTDYSLIPDPADWYSMIDDFAGASMPALDIIIEFSRDNYSAPKLQLPSGKINAATTLIINHLAKDGKISESALAYILAIDLSTLRDYLSKAKLSKRKVGQKGEVDLLRKDLNMLRKFYESSHPKATAHQILRNVLITKAKSIS